MEIGDRVPSALDQAYSNYSAFCERLGCPPASFESWLRIERHGCGPVPHGVGMQSPAIRKEYQRTHSAEIAARRQQVIETYHL
jgi:hypothetical protein